VIVGFVSRPALTQRTLLRQAAAGLITPQHQILPPKAEGTVLESYQVLKKRERKLGTLESLRLSSPRLLSRIEDTQRNSAKPDPHAPADIQRLGRVLRTTGKRKVRHEACFVVGWTNSLVLFRDGDLDAKYSQWVVKKNGYSFLHPTKTPPLDFLRYLVGRALKYPRKYVSSIGTVNECLKEARLHRILSIALWRIQVPNRGNFSFGNLAKLNFHWWVRALPLSRETQTLVQAPRLRGSSTVGAPSVPALAGLVDALIAEIQNHSG